MGGLLTNDDTRIGIERLRAVFTAATGVKAIGDGKCDILENGLRAVRQEMIRMCQEAADETDQARQLYKAIQHFGCDGYDVFRFVRVAKHEL